MNINVSSPATLGQETSIEQTDLVSLVTHQEQAGAETALEKVYQRFQTLSHDFCAVMEDGKVVGLCSRAHLGFVLGHRFGFSIMGRQQVRQHLVEHPVILRRGTPIRQALELTLGRQGKEFYEDVILVGAEDQFLGIIPVPALVRLQSALVEERFRVQQALNRRLVDVSRQAGMAEVATGILHNVGNVLNSVNVSATRAMDMMKNSRIANLEKLTKILEQKREQLGDYLTHDPKGKLVPEYFSKLTGALRAEQNRQLEELASLANHIGHIKNIIATQQGYAKMSGMLEIVPVQEIVEEGLKIHAEELKQHGVELVRSFEPVPPVLVDKHKVLQILINLVRNAKQASDHGSIPSKRVTVSIQAPTKERVHIQVEDNGVGIAPENLKRIFAHGFTTKKDGHGFGLHTAALAAKEMGGALRVHSEGAGRGALFTLELPVALNPVSS